MRGRRRGGGEEGEGEWGTGQENQQDDHVLLHNTNSKDEYVLNKWPL